MNKPAQIAEAKEWVPSVGDDVMTSCGKVIIKLIKDKQACVEFSSGSIDVVQLSCLKPIDKDRERVISEASKVFHSKCMSNYSGQPFLDGLGALYDAGMLKSPG